MTDISGVVATDFLEASPRVGAFKRFTRVFFGRGVVVFGIVVIMILVVTAIFAPLLAPYDPYKQDLDNILSKPTTKHLLGTDTVGRDTLSRIIYGSRTSLLHRPSCRKEVLLWIGHQYWTGFWNTAYRF